MMSSETQRKEEYIVFKGYFIFNFFLLEKEKSNLFLVRLNKLAGTCNNVQHLINIFNKQYSTNTI